MKLLKLKLHNFQGIRDLELDIDGKSVSVYGDNATGKTTVFNAFTWLLFDKASTGAKNFSPKTKGKEGDLHGLEHSSEAVCQLEDERIISFKKVYKEVYKKTRGSAHEEFSGHTTDYFIDGMPVKEKEYTDTINSLFGESEQLKMLTMPHYFSEDMRWEDRRKILLEICGDISDEEVINSTEELKELKDYLLMPGTMNQYYTVDDYRKIASSKMSEINKQLASIPNRVDEAQRAMPDIEGISLDRLKARIKELEAKKEELEREKVQILSGDAGSAEIRKQIAEKEAELSEARAKHSEYASKINSDRYQEIGELEKRISKLNIELCKIDNEKYATEKEVTRMQDLRQELLDEYRKLYAEQWDENKAICPTCKRELPEEDVESMKEEFNLRKSKRLEGINERGKKEASKEMIAEAQEKIALKEKEYQDLLAEIKTLEENLASVRSSIKKIDDFESMESYKTLKAQIEELKEKERKGYTDNQMLAASVTAKIHKIQEEIQKQEEIRAKFAVVEVQTNRIQELMNEEKELSKEYQDYQKGVYLCETFTRTKVSMLDEKINSKFKNVRFRLFIEQVNGGLREDCEVLVPADDGRLVPFSIANNAGRINAGLEIIDTLATHWRLSMPVFVDNAESVTRLINTDTQVIRLVVSEVDKKLRLEKGE